MSETIYKDIDLNCSSACEVVFELEVLLEAIDTGLKRAKNRIEFFRKPELKETLARFLSVSEINIATEESRSRIEDQLFLKLFRDAGKIELGVAYELMPLVCAQYQHELNPLIQAVRLSERTVYIIVQILREVDEFDDPWPTTTASWVSICNSLADQIADILGQAAKLCPFIRSDAIRTKLLYMQFGNRLFDILDAPAQQSVFEKVKRDSNEHLILQAMVKLGCVDEETKGSQPNIIKEMDPKADANNYKRYFVNLQVKRIITKGAGERGFFIASPFHDGVGVTKIDTGSTPTE